MAAAISRISVSPIFLILFAHRQFQQPARQPFGRDAATPPDAETSRPWNKGINQGAQWDQPRGSRRSTSSTPLFRQNSAENGEGDQEDQGDQRITKRS